MLVLAERVSKVIGGVRLVLCVVYSIRRRPYKFYLDEQGFLRQQAIFSAFAVRIGSGNRIVLREAKNLNSSIEDRGQDARQRFNVVHSMFLRLFLNLLPMPSVECPAWL